MARSRFTARTELGRWVGTLEDVGALIKRAIALLGRGGSPPACEIKVEQPGLTLEYEDVDEFVRATTPSDLARITQIGAYVSDRAGTTDGDGQTTKVALTIAPSHALLQPPVAAQVSGGDRTIVEGVSAQLAETAQEGQRFPAAGGNTVSARLLTISMFLFLLAAVTGWGYDATPEAVTDLDPTLSAFIVVGAVCVVITLISAPWILLFPRFEWLGADERTRWDRSRGWVLKAAGALALAVTSGVIVALLT